MPELNTGGGGGELPTNHASFAVSLGNPRLYLFGHLFNSCYPPAQTLTAKNTNFQLDHVKP